MRWATYRHKNAELDCIGLVAGDHIHGLEPGRRLLDLLGDDGAKLRAAGEEAQSRPAEVMALTEVQLRPPLPHPPTVRDFMSFEQHIKTARARRGQEMEPVWYQQPVFYFSNPHVLLGPDEPVPIPDGCLQMDFELEIGAIIGREGHDLTPAEAEACIAGFTIFNDWSARDIQYQEMRLGLGPAKGKDFASSLGPWLVTVDELAFRRKGNGYDLTMVARVNGKEWSRASFADIYWSFGEMIAYASRASRIMPGDVIGSGTCGTGCIMELSLVHDEQAYPWLRPGDRVEIDVDGLGVLANTLVAGPPAKPLRE